MKKITTLILLFCFGSMVAQTNNELLFLRKDYPQIIHNTSALLSIDDFYWQAKALGASGKSMQAIKVAEQGLSTFQHATVLKQQLANFYFDAGSYRLAKPLLHSLRNHDEENLRQLIRILEFEQNYATAVSFLDSAYQVDTTNLWVMKHLAINYQNMENKVLAMHFYDKALQTNPEDLITRYRAAKYLIKVKEYETAVKHCNDYLAQDSLNQKFLKLKSIALFNAKCYYPSKEGFYQLYAMGDTSVFICKHIAICEVKQISHDTAIFYLEKIREQQKKDFEWHFYYGLCLMESDHPAEALPYFAKADSLMLPDPRIMEAVEQNRANVFELTGRYQEKLNSLQKAYTYSENPEYLFKIATLYHKRLKNLEKALAAYEEFLMSLEDIPSADLRPGDTYISYEDIAKQQIEDIKKELFFRNASE